MSVHWYREKDAERAWGERVVLAFYYAWYDMATWQEPLPDRPLHTYMSTDPAAIERHVLWALVSIHVVVLVRLQRGVIDNLLSITHLL